MSFQFEKLNLLLVEDILPMRTLMASVLKNFNINSITFAADGQEAFEKFKKENHDIIMSDWVMSPMDGIELTREVRTNTLSPNRMVPIILITGYSAWSRVETARDAGVTEFLTKPFTAKDMARRLGHVITHPRDFIETTNFFGPDRRRRVDPEFTGPYRREKDQKAYSARGN